MDNNIWSRLGLSQPPKLVKVLLFALAAIIALAFVFSLFGSVVRPVLMNSPLSSYMPMMQDAPYGSSYGEGTMGYAGGYAGEYYAKDMDVPTLSTRNVAALMPSPRPPYYGGTTGNTAESFEVTDYSATIETGDLEGTCAKFTELKTETYVIFENANESDTSCSYTFKVEHDRADEVLNWLKDLDPRDLSESTYTIKRQIDDFTKEEEVLTAKKAAIEDTLANALEAYDDVTRLATATQDADALARIINSRIEVIERLTQESITINEQLDRLALAKSEQLDRLDYTYFNAYVYERRLVDGEQLADSWKAAVEKFVMDLNRAVQDATVGVLAFLVSLIPLILYVVVVLVIAKYGWKYVRKFWQS